MHAGGCLAWHSVEEADENVLQESARYAWLAFKLTNMGGNALWLMVVVVVEAFNDVVLV
jgi:hypothetical protein